MGYAALFPGQGSQAVGMGAQLFAEHEALLGETADDVLGWSLRQACLDGPLERLTRTEIAQPALYALSYAAWTSWRRVTDELPIGAAGHSLGEYTALAAAGAFDYYEGLALVAARGAAMAAAAEATPSTMAAVIGADVDALEKICDDRRRGGGHLWVANLNAPGQTVVAGATPDIAWLSEQAAGLGIRRVIPLQVAGAFHTPLMEQASLDFGQALAAVAFRPLAFPVWSNVDGAPHVDVADALVRQLTSPVRFAESLQGLATSGAGAFVHIGPGDVTAGMARRTVPDAVTAAVGDASSASAAAESISVD